jgi:type IV pilus assembly protein PilQ
MPLPDYLTGTDIGFARPASGPAAPEAQNPPAADAQAPAPAPMPEKRYTGDPISVNLKDVDLKDFFRLIHEISGLNVVLDPSVRGTVTLVLDEVPWDQGLDIVLRNNGLTKEIDGNVLRIATQDTLKREADQRRELVKAQSDAVEPVTVTRVLSYAQANTMVPTMKKFLTARGDVYADVRSNTLIIRDIPASIPKVDNLLRQLDRKSQQVEIDARVVQTSRTFARELGTQLAYSFGAGNNVVGGNSAVGTSPISRLFVPGVSTSPALIAGAPPSGGGAATPVAMPLATSLGATAATSGLTYLFTSKNFALDFMLSAMESRGVGKILSEPKGITQNNEKLTVKQGSQVPIQTNINNTIAVQYVDAVLKLEVTPQITAEGTVFMEITVENTQIDKSISVQGTPALDTQSTQTKVLINDGGTVVIGGVVVTNQNTTVDQVPLLGSVPLIGNLFKHTSISVSTQELMFFVTPRILPG